MRQRRKIQLAFSLAAILFLANIAACVVMGWLSVNALWLYLGMSALTFAVFALDKFQAIKGGGRVSEKSLLSISLLGGWPGALLAQQWLRHKTVKQPFLTQLMASIALNMVGLIYLATAGDPEVLLKSLGF